MNSFRAIRASIALSQAQLGEALGMTQGNVSFYEKGQTVPPEVARRLIAHAATLGVALTFDHIYGDKPLPPAREIGAAAQALPADHDDTLSKLDAARAA